MPRARKQQSECTYSYPPLQHPDSIRLLTLHPGEFTSPIQISLAVVRSREDHDYEALSYTWATENGNYRRSSQIRCEGARIWVTKNCELALRYLRKENANRALWVDAICINQKDDTERGHQVGMMGSLYSKASEVLIWLGESSLEVGTLKSINHFHISDKFDSTPSFSLVPKIVVDNEQSYGDPNHLKRRPSMNQDHIPVSDIFLEYVRKMSPEIRSRQSSGQDPKSSPLYQQLLSRIHEGYSGSVYTELYLGFKDIVRRRWWSRVWVIQEVALARSASLICSNRAVKYDDFLNWYQTVANDSTPKGRVAYSYLHKVVHHMGAVSGAQVEQLNPLEVLQWTRGLNASDPRDIIFSVLGLSKDFRSLLPVPNYRKSIAQVFTEVAKLHLSMTKSLAILEHATNITPSIKSPSWVPYWSDSEVFAPFIHTSMQASRNSKARILISPDDQSLRIKGLKFDKVKRLPLADLRAYADHASNEERFEGWRMSCGVSLTLKHYPTGELVEEALWRTLCWNTDCLGWLVKKEMESCFKEWHRILTTSNTSEECQEKLRRKQNEFQQEIYSTNPLCTTAKGYLAAVPLTTKVGDCIAVLAGGRVPFVLRPTGDHYRLVGPCYVHGIMEGEAFPENLDELTWLSVR